MTNVVNFVALIYINYNIIDAKYVIMYSEL